ncbi:MAG: ABC transporter ATP-binding protein [Acidobacteriota bacterium]
MDALLEARCLTVRLGEREIVRGVDLALRPGDLLAVAGPNGAGKTTLLRALAGVLPAADGEILLDGRPLRARARREIARILAYLPQETWTPFSVSVADVVALGRYAHVGPLRPLGAEDRRVCLRAMEQADVAHLARRALPSLSGGERRRVFLARAIAQQARVLVLDEPTSALDVGHALDTIRLLAGLARDGRAVLFSLHDLALALRGPTGAVLLDRGRVVAAGDPAATLTGPAAEAAFGVPLSVTGPPFAVVPGDVRRQSVSD